MGKKNSALIWTDTGMGIHLMHSAWKVLTPSVTAQIPNSPSGSLLSPHYGGVSDEDRRQNG
jgi:hypothetical protein